MRPPRFSTTRRFKSPSLIISWNGDIAKLGSRVTDYLNRKLGSESLDEIDPADFFPLNGVTIENDMVRFPENRLYVCPKHSLMIFKGDAPGYEWHKFFNSILDMCEHYGGVKELYIIGGMVMLAAHTAPREIIPVFNSPELKRTVSHHNLGKNMDYQTPAGQRPTLNSYLLWVARQRKVPAATLWVPVPFYLAGVDDPKAQRRLLEFLDRRLGLKIDLRDMDDEVTKQNDKLARIRASSPEINECISKLEVNTRLTDKESEELVGKIHEALTQKSGLGV